MQTCFILSRISSIGILASSDNIAASSSSSSSASSPASFFNSLMVYCNGRKSNLSNLYCQRMKHNTKYLINCIKRFSARPKYSLMQNIATFKNDTTECNIYAIFNGYYTQGTIHTKTLSKSELGKSLENETMYWCHFKAVTFRLF